MRRTDLGECGLGHGKGEDVGRYWEEIREDAELPGNPQAPHRVYWEAQEWPRWPWAVWGDKKRLLDLIKIVEQILLAIWPASPCRGAE